MKLLVFAASHRAESYNRKLAALSAEYLTSKNVTVDFAEYADFDMPVYNDVVATDNVPVPARVFAHRAANAEGILVCSPEYNWSYPGSLKNIIDWTSRITPAPLKGKTALLMSATPGARGGILGLNHLKTPFEALQMFVFPKMFPLPEAQKAFGTSGLSESKKQQQLLSILDDYVTFTSRLTNPG
jgi:chromate reductase, NAD(P)H dehydrogenase (quinone)